MQTKIGHCGKSLADPGCRVQQTGGGFCDALWCDPALAHCSTNNRNIHWKYTSEADVDKVLEPARVCSEAQAEHEEGQSTLLAHRRSLLHSLFGMLGSLGLWPLGPPQRTLHKDCRVHSSPRLAREFLHRGDGGGGGGSGSQTAQI